MCYRSPEKMERRGSFPKEAVEGRSGHGSSSLQLTSPSRYSIFAWMFIPSSAILPEESFSPPYPDGFRDEDPLTSRVKGLENGSF